MALVRCVDCKKYIDDSEAVTLPIDDNHDAVYCIVCSPEDSYLSSDEYDEEE